MIIDSNMKHPFTASCEWVLVFLCSTPLGKFLDLLVNVSKL